MVASPTVNAESYDLDEPLLEDAPDATPKHGTSIQSGWGAADALLKPKNASGEYPNDFRFSDSVQLVRFLEDEPFSVYYQHWIDRTEGKRSFVCLEGEEQGCPLCDIVGDKPRGKFAFNVLVVSDEEPTVQIMTAPPTFARQLRAANDDTRRGPLTKYYWAISRQGSGPQTTYTLERVRPSDLAEEWELDADKLDAIASDAVKYGPETVYVTPRAELLTLARSLV
jgi:hypothetical protein